jgi:hypothetical protein
MLGRRSGWDAMHSFVIPAHDEEACLPATLDALVAAADKDGRLSPEPPCRAKIGGMAVEPRPQYYGYGPEAEREGGPNG